MYVGEGERERRLRGGRPIGLEDGRREEEDSIPGAVADVDEVEGGGREGGEAAAEVGGGMEGEVVGRECRDHRASTGRMRGGCRVCLIFKKVLHE